ncbi:MAG: acyl--CoA ligase [Oscillospiraceae bacterium]|nr:acyl--CoA ligase [Oscillospiraceae bacterium]
MRFSRFEDMLGHWAAAAPEAVALRFVGGTCTYAELLERVRAKAEALRAGGGSCLGILCDGSPECVVTIFAAAQAGMQAVLLNANTPEPLLREQLKATDVDRLCGCAARRGALLDGLGGGIPAGTGAGRVLFFTSGTSARAKAVVLTEGNLCASAWNGSAMVPLDRDDTLLCMLPLDHVFGFICGILWGLSCGATVALGRGRSYYTEDCPYYRPSALAVAPALLRHLLKNRCLGDSLRVLIVGAGDCPWALLKAVEAMGVRVCHGYGLTETSSGVCLSRGEDFFAMDLCPDARVSIAPDGEILISSPELLFEGYYRRPEDTARVLRDGVFHTGDLGCIDADGRLHVTGRKKEIMALSDGTKLSLPEYEKDLARILETAEIAVVPREDVPVLVLPRGTMDRDEALSRLASTQALLPPEQQLGDVVYYNGPLPRTAAGKLMRWQIAGAAAGRHGHGGGGAEG